MRKANLRSSPRSEKARETLQSLLTLGQIRFEKCELKEASVAFTMALDQARKLADLRAMMESIAGLLRLSTEALDEAAIRRWDEELDQLMAANPKHIPALAYQCKGMVSRKAEKPRNAQRYFHRYICAVRADAKRNPSADPDLVDTSIAKGWVSIAISFSHRNRLSRARLVANSILKKYEGRNLRGINGTTYLLIGNLCERQKDYEGALKWFQKAHGAFLSEHNWYYHLYVLYGYARLNRLQQNYSQAYWYLELVDRAISGIEFGFLRREIITERMRLEQDAVDLLIDSRRGLVQTREGGEVSLRKQYVLLHILEALSTAHSRYGDDLDRGLSKAEIIEHVWKEQYRPEAHDNKLYYNINRLRKLIEPDIRKPQYLLNWKEGYRLAPGLKVQLIGTKVNSSGGKVS